MVRGTSSETYHLPKCVVIALMKAVRTFNRESCKKVAVSVSTLQRFHIFSAIPALQPIVHDLFVLRGSNKADAGKELETQKEVVVSMLLRLIQHHQVARCSWAVLECLHYAQL